MFSGFVISIIWFVIGLSTGHIIGETQAYKKANKEMSEYLDSIGNLLAGKAKKK
jgi:hypothetical protein